jgi:thioredoxin-like negative regulator of GroEL
MMPMVHGLEKRYAGKVDFVYLNAEDDRTADVRQRFDFKGTPLFVFVDAAGTPVGKPRYGLVPEQELTASLDALVSTSAGSSP